MVLLVAVLVVSTLVMVLGQSLTALGAELLGAWLVCWSILVLILAGQIMMAQVAVLSLLVAGVPLLLRAGGGLYWLVPGDPSVA